MVVLLRSRIAKSSAACDIPLLLPSEIVTHSQSPIQSEALSIQWDLEYTLAGDMLDRIQQGLIQRKYLFDWKNKYSHGQKDSTRSSATIRNLQSKIDASAARYQLAREALVSLAPRIGKVGWEGIYQKLDKGDIRGLNEGYFDDENTEQADMSWIWCVQGINNGSEKEMHDTLRIAWCKSRARAHRYQEESILLQEEMCCIQEAFKYEANLWAVRAGVTQVTDKSNNVKRFADESAEMLEGRRAYAFYQVYVRLSMMKVCSITWQEIPRKFYEGLGAIRLDDAEYVV
ncbi:hypothetical protein VKT23_009484 [Stygiomarasmius scandens]|uniref:Uncharacterized protein n=1 Tax=Marasmiellus scandens TaxID=2682957 RepID=A0ABR1JIJ9_9AGAR